MVKPETRFESRARFLLIEDDPIARRALAHIIGPYGEVFVASTACAAESMLQGKWHWCAILADVGLPDGSGLEVMARARPEHAQTPLLFLTGRADAETLNAAYDLGGHCVAKPVDTGRIRRFVADALKARVSACAALDALAARYEFSEAEVDVLRRAAAGEDRHAIASARSSSVETVKKHIGSMLVKTGADSLHALVLRCLLPG
jgi:DNA-binding NarL/FixJ family response regulator